MPLWILLLIGYGCLLAFYLVFFYGIGEQSDTPH